MANDQNRHSSGENWDKNQGRYVDDHNFNNSGYRQGQNRQRGQGRNRQSGDLDRDGFTGHTGGFYGGTSYLGSNYDDWMNNQIGAGQSYNTGSQDDQQSEGSSGNRYRQDFRNRQDERYQQGNWGQQLGNQGGGQHGYGGSYDEDQRYRASGGQSYDNQQRRYGQQENRPSYGQQSGYQSSQGNQHWGREDEHYHNQQRSGNQWGMNQGYGNSSMGDMYGQSHFNPGGPQQGAYREGGQQAHGDWGRQPYENRQQEGQRGQDRDWWERTRDEVSSWFGDRSAERRREMDRRMEGAHRGKGPKTYNRSDDRIREDVCDRLSDDGYVDASDIDVRIENGEVTLTGTVDSRQAKRRAEDLVESISGVRHVQNNLRVGQAPTIGSTTIRTSATGDNSSHSGSTNS
ncbi:MAG TPA: BON domain-containing protein [Chitinophagaceae bacterium]|jgi:osmotically-inducible protein OsmY|nr:BON domain-containing protein [Chitinophagaceae bacterium]